MEDSSYIADPQDRYEAARLDRQGKLLTRECGEVFLPEHWNSRQRVLDVGCGTGEWVLHMAVTYPHLEVYGIDISSNMIQHARNLALATRARNAHFLVMDATEPLKFPDQYFDSINARVIGWFLSPELWPKLLKEGWRLLGQDGSIRLIEYETAFANKFGPDYANQILFDALHRTGRTFSPTGRSAGFACILERLLQSVGFVGIQQRGFCINTGRTGEGFEDWREDFLILCRTIGPFIVQSGAMTEKAFEKLAQQIQEGLDAEDYRATAMYVTAWAYKPE